MTIPIMLFWFDTHKTSSQRIEFHAVVFKEFAFERVIVHGPEFGESGVFDGNLELFLRKGGNAIVEETVLQKNGFVVGNGEHGGFRVDTRCHEPFIGVIRRVFFEKEEIRDPAVGRVAVFARIHSRNLSRENLGLVFQHIGLHNLRLIDNFQKKRFRGLGPSTQIFLQQNIIVMITVSRGEAEMILEIILRFLGVTFFITLHVHKHLVEYEE